MSTSLIDLSRPAGEAPDRVTVPAPAVRWRTRLLLPLALLAIVAILVLLTAREAVLPRTPVRVVPVVVKTVSGPAGSAVVQAPGWLEPDPYPWYVAALADGVVEEVLALEGSRVERGQVVARLVDDDARLTLQGAEAELGRRAAELDARRADREAARLRLEHLIETTRADAVAEAGLAEARAEANRVRADVAVEEARLAELADELRRKAPLTETQAVAEAAVARLRLRVDAQAAVVEATRARAEVAAARVRQAEAERDAARTRRSLLIDERRAAALAEADVAAAEAAVALARAARDDAALQLQRMEVRSPVDGIVMRRLVAPGSKVTRAGDEHSAHVVHVYDPRHMQVRVDVPIADAARIAVDQAVEVTVEVLPERTFRGRVTRLVHEADIQKNTVEVKVGLDDPDEELKPEMLARVRFLARGAAPGGSVRQRLFMPEALLAGGADGPSVLVVRDVLDRNGRVARVRVEAGAQRLDGWIEIDSGLHVGDLLVAEPTDVAPGDRVRIVGEQVASAGGPS